MPTEIPFINDLIQFGLSGLIIFIILRPILNWFMKRADEKDQHINELVQNHFSQDKERHQKMMETLDRLPEKIVLGITKIYNPKIYKRRYIINGKKKN